MQVLYHSVKTNTYRVIHFSFILEYRVGVLVRDSHKTSDAILCQYPRHVGGIPAT